MYSINLKTLLTAIFLTLFSQTAWAEDAKPIPLEPTVLERSVIQQKLKNILQDALKAAPSRVEKLKQLAEQDKLVVEQNKLLVPKVRMAIGKCWRPPTSALHKRSRVELRVEIDKTGKVISVKTNSDFDSLAPAAYKAIFACLPKALSKDEFKRFYEATNGVFQFNFDYKFYN
ncbi:hypothetical protein N8524_11010 [Candidatus Puniceispirillum sp.]|nr:hypothetical protein [Candidatus Puniceispirillum sp.]